MDPGLTPSARFAGWIDAGGDAAAWTRLSTRWWSDRRIHRVTHRRKIELILDGLGAPGTLVEFCRGASVDGIGGVLAAHRGWTAHVVTPSASHESALRRMAAHYPPRGSLHFHRGSLEDLPDLEDVTYDAVLALHMLEHVDNIPASLQALRRHRGRHYVLAVPTCLSPVSLVRLGGSDPYRWDGAASVRALVRGAARVVGAALRGKVAVTETVLEGPVVTLHRWFLPRAFVRFVEQHGYDLQRAVPDALVIPWAERASVWLASRRLPYHLAFMAYFGFGTHFVFKQSPESDWSDVWA